MDVEDKLDALADAARFDVCAASCGSGPGRVRDDLKRDTNWLYPVKLPDGRTENMLKVLMSGQCINNCRYCASAGRCAAATDASFTHDELARTFHLMNRERLAQGFFLSSAIEDSPERQMDGMVRTCEILRTRYRFRGFIHLKVLPGAPVNLVEAGARYANRMSINYEAATGEGLKKLAPQKNIDYVRRTTTLLSRLARDRSLALRGQTTQFIVGATDETDRTFIDTIENLVSDRTMKRIYFNSFSPVEGTPMAGRTASPLDREIRLYQAEHLIRQYGFGSGELVVAKSENLPPGTDVKYASALAHPEWFPVEINRASKLELLRVPGIGPKSASRIVKARSEFPVKRMADLRKMGVVTRRAEPFILLSGKSVGTSLLPFRQVV